MARDDTCPTELVIKEDLVLIEPGVYFAKIEGVSVWLFVNKKQIKVTDEEREISFTRSLLPRKITTEIKSGLFIFDDWDGMNIAASDSEEMNIRARKISEEKPFIVTRPGIAVQRCREIDTKIVWLSDPAFKAEFYCPITDPIKDPGWIPKDQKWGVWGE